MKIGGIQKLSLIDYPHMLSAVLFTIGCNFRCPFCHNPTLVIPEKYAQSIDVDGIFKFLEERKKYINGVVITGGEPTLYPDLPEFIKKIKGMGYAVKLDTNGSNPEMLERLIDEKLVDYVAMDIKAPLERYSELTNTDVDIEKIKKSIEILKKSKVKYEFRTTVAPNLTFEDIEKICGEVGGAEYYLQQFEGYNKELVRPELQKAIGPSKEKLKEWSMKIREKGRACEVR